MQPWETRLVALAAARRAKRENDLAVSAGYFAALFERQEKLKPLTHYIKPGETRRAGKAQSQDEIRANFRAWARTPMKGPPDG